jgi:thioredoxin-like negative regulator of GroEL
MRKALLLTGALLTASTVGCRKKSETTDRAESAGTTAERPVAAEAEIESPLEWIHDDYPRALAAARESGKPLLIDMWAPWCHTCLSMQQTVLVDPSLARYADRFVWVALDTDKPVNAEAVARYPQSVWPTFFVVAADEESIATRYQGAATFPQFRELLESGERMVRDGSDLEADSPLWHLREGDRKMAAGEPAAAASAFAAALEAAPEDWPRRPDVLVSQITALHSADEHAECVKLGAENIDATLPARSASTTDMALFANDCLSKLPDEGRATAVRLTLVAAIEKVASDPRAGLSADDRSDAQQTLRALHGALGNSQRARAAAERQREVLTKALADARTAREKMIYGYQWADVHIYLGEPAKAIPALEATAKALPKEYDAQYRLASIQLAAGKHDEALAAAERAIELGYGPRKENIYSLLARIHEARGDTAGVKKTLEALIAHLEALPEGQRSRKAIDGAKARLAAMK